MQELLDRSSNQLSVRGEASSKFLSVDGFGGGNADIGGGGHQNRVPPTARTMPEDVGRRRGDRCRGCVVRRGGSRAPPIRLAVARCGKRDTIVW